mgnify:CR=1 FL=1
MRGLCKFFARTVQNPPLQQQAIAHTADGLDQARLAKHIAYDRATIGGVVKRLENKGLVTRNQSEKDRRAFDLSLSPKGKALLAEITPIVVGLQDEILPHLSPEEKDTVHDLMKKALCIRN